MHDKTLTNIHRLYITKSGGVSVLFYPEEITSEHFRDKLELQQLDAERKHAMQENNKY